MSEPDAKRWKITLLLVVALALGAGLRLVALGQKPLWYDELVSLEAASLGVSHRS